MQCPRGQALAARCAGARGDAVGRQSTRRRDRRSHVFQQGGLLGRPFICGRRLWMQLKSKAPPAKAANTRRRLMAASCALLSAGAARSQEPSAASAHSGLLEDWSVDSALAYYHENGRVTAVEPVVDVSKVFADGQSLNLNATFDALSGASPNGALPSRSPQTFASPSGKAAHVYTIAPGQLPADPNYNDTRVAAGGNWTKPLTRIDELSVGGKVSAEDDFVSATVEATIAHDLNHKNTTLSFGLSNEF